MVRNWTAQAFVWGPERTETKENPLSGHDFKHRVWPLSTLPGLKDGQKYDSVLIHGWLLMAWLDH